MGKKQDAQPELPPLDEDRIRAFMSAANDVEMYGGFLLNGHGDNEVFRAKFERGVEDFKDALEHYKAATR